MCEAGGDDGPPQRPTDGPMPRVDREFLPDILVELGYNVTERMLERAFALRLSDYLHCDDFVIFVDLYRKMEVEEFNERAGFDEEEVEIYRETFDSYDRDGGGQLSIKELMPVLASLGREPKSVIQREKLTKLISDVDSDGSGEIDFREFLQLMRRFIEEAQQEQLRKERGILQKTGFTDEEVAQWRDVFVKFDDDDSGEFDHHEGKKLLQAVGVTLNDRNMHEQYMQIFREVDVDKNNQIDFPEFLLMMRKVIQLDFGGLATRTNLSVPQGGKKKRRGPAGESAE